MLFWLAPVLAALVLLWVGMEAARAGLPLFGLGISFFFATSAFCGDVLVLGYSAAGFYLVSILVSLPYGLGVLGSAPSLRGLMARAALAGALMGLTTIARSVSLTVLPSLLVIAALGARRLVAPRWGRFVLFLLTAAFLIGPTLLLRAHLEDSARRAVSRFGGGIAPASHDIWITYWQGLGDFDRTHGHVFLDQAGLGALRERGGFERVSERSEAIMRGLVIESIRSEPTWFALILAKRAMLTLSFRKLWPRASPGSPGFFPSVAPNEGVTDSYWAMTDQADMFRVGSSRAEIPAILFPLGLIAFFLAGSGRLGAYPNDRRVRMRWIVGLLAFAALPGPVATTTAGAFEPQSFVVVIFAAAAGLIQIAFWAIAGRARRAIGGGMAEDQTRETEP
jgi:hypothetical protein